VIIKTSTNDKIKWQLILFLFYGLPELGSGGYVMRVPSTLVQGKSV